MPSDQMYQKAVELAKYTLAQLDAANGVYVSVLNGSAEAKEQVKRLEKAIKTSDPKVTAISCLISEAGLTELTKRNLYHSPSITALIEDPKVEKLKKAMDRNEELVKKHYAKSYLDAKVPPLTQDSPLIQICTSKKR